MIAGLRALRSVESRFVRALGLVMIMAFAVATLDGAQAARPSTLGFARMPLAFEADGPGFVARGQGYSIAVAPTQVVLGLAAATLRGGPAVVRMRLVGAESGASLQGLVPLPSRSHYLIGDDPLRWRTNVGHYGRVQAQSVYPGVDVVYYGNGRRLEYDFVIAPGADPDVIRLAFEGADGVEVGDDGDLVMRLRGGEVRQRPPLVYQEIDGTRREIAGAYVLDDDGHVRFRLAEYEKTARLVIDPTLVYSTYLGGSSVDYGFDVAADAAGSAYVTGMTLSSDFPTMNAMQPGFGGAGAFWGDAFVAKFDPSGALVYATFLGGNDSDAGVRIAVDATGHAYVAGQTWSANFPVVNAFQPAFGGSSSDGFVAKLAADGSGLVYSTYLGGSQPDGAFGIAVDAAGHAYVSGDTHSTNFPVTPGAFQPSRAGFIFNADAFVTKLSPTGTALVYSTYLGGTAQDANFRLAIDAGGNAYVTGFTLSNDFPIANAFQPTRGPSIDCFVTKLNAAGSALVYSTFLGGSGDEYCTAIAADASGNATAGGRTTSDADFPIANAVQPVFGGNADGFVTKLGPMGALVYSTYLGGLFEDSVEDLELDRDGNAYVAGTTMSDDFPILDPAQPTFAGEADAFVTKIAASGSALVYSTFVGGTSSDFGKGVAVDGNGDAYVVGGTISTDFPTRNAAQPSPRGSTDGFVAKLGTPLFPGGGQRPRDVNQFLQYVSPRDSQTHLAAGTTSFQVTIVYGPTIDPSTFRATLEGAPFAGFTPVRGTRETVSVPLARGRNVLRLEVIGVRSDGRTGTDQDMLTFVVP